MSSPVPAAEIFLKQSFRSNYCGPYASGMLLSLMGFPMTRRRSLALFGIRTMRKDYRGATLSAIEEVVTATTGRLARWMTATRYDFDALRNLLEAQARPRLALLTFRARYRGRAATHTAVVTGVSRSEIRLLDPLGACPPPRRLHNAVLRDDGSIEGCSYHIETRKPIAVLLLGAIRSADVHLPVV